MEKKLHLTWNIYQQEIDSMERYCHNCGEKVSFKDSLKRRQNANGKNIYHFAIYKCPKGHSWNKSIEIIKAYNGLENNEEEKTVKNDQYDAICFKTLREKEITEIVIQLKTCEIRERLDKFLTSKIIDKSRNEINELIANGYILMNDQRVKVNKKVNHQDTIVIKL